MLRIQRSFNGGVVFSLSGRIEAADITELERLLGLETDGARITFDLTDVTVVDFEAVKFLGRREALGIRFESCPAYIREWIDSGRRRSEV